MLLFNMILCKLLTFALTQVTTYSHKDDNNLWKVKPADQDVDSSETVTLLKSGDLVRLEHVM